MDPTPVGPFPHGGWDPLGVVFTIEDLDLAQMVLGQGPPAAHQVFDRMTFDIHADSVFASPEEYPIGSFLDPTLIPSPNGNSLTGSTGIPLSMEEKYSCNLILPDFTGILPVEGSCCSDNNVAGDAPADQDDREASAPEAKRKCMESDSCTGEEDDAETDVPENLKTRKPGASGDRGKKNVPPKKKQKLAKLSGDEGEEGNNNIAGQDGRSSSTCCSEEDGVCQELDNDKWAQNSDESSAIDGDGNGKATTRASRSAATDPQSLYARRRRPRINERLRILQSLIPNGTKVDISTMLEEAVRYGKFLQLQIKLSSSDELWMYVPIAYNGMDIGLNQILPSQLL